MKLLRYLTLILILPNSYAKGQNSFQVTPINIGIPPNTHGVSDFLVDENDELSYFNFIGGNPENIHDFFIGYSISENSNSYPVKMISFPLPPDSDIRFSFLGEVKNEKYICPLKIFGGLVDDLLVFYDKQNNIGWAKEFGMGEGRPLLEFDASDNIYLAFQSSGSSDNNLAFHKFDSMGKHIFSQEIGFEVDFFVEDIRGVQSQTTTQEEILILASLYPNNGGFDFTSLLAKINLNGEPQHVVQFKDSSSFYSDLKVDNQDNIYLLGRTMTDSTFSDNEADCILTKLDANFNHLWTKIIHGKYFDYQTSSLNILNNGNLAVAYSTKGAFPVVLLVIDSSGEPLYQRGYPFYQPKVVTLSDGSIAMAATKHFNEDGSVFDKIIFAKTDSLGFLPGCVDFKTCLDIEDSFVEIEEITAFTIEIDTLLNYGMTVTDSFELVEPFCDIPPAPNPDFSIPDSVCVSTTVTTTGVYNRFAHGIEWRLTGLNTDSLLTDSTNFVYSFAEPGEYVLTQTIYFLGCGYFSERNITVLPALELDFVVPDTLCEEQFLLAPLANRPLQELLWSDSSTQENLTLTESGWVHLRANDGFCVAEDSIEIRFLKDLLPDFAQPFNVANDTIVCEVHLPHFLKAGSNYGNEFSLNGEPFTDSVAIFAAGIYDIEFQIGDCSFYQSYELMIETCPALVYFPNVFSPNNDGINDRFFPQGDNFVAEKLLIFDRWGGLLYEGTGNNAFWTGRFNNRTIKSGVYVYQFFYQNLLTEEENVLSGSVSVVY